MSKATIPSIITAPTLETSGNSVGSASPPFHLNVTEREAQRYNPIELLSWARSIIKYSEIRGGEWSLLEVNSATSVDMTYDGIGVVSGLP
jgi:hypothetical protein